MTIRDYNNHKDFYDKFAIYICQKLNYSIEQEMYHGVIEWYDSHKEHIIVEEFMKVYTLEVYQGVYS
jgi:hypothetical protein